MAIYTVNGAALNPAYDYNGETITKAYSMDGTKVFPDAPIQFKLATYNVGGWYIGSGANVPTAKEPAYYEMQGNVLDSVDADVLFLEEYWTYFSGDIRASTLLNERYTYTHGVNGTATYLGRCLCSKYPVIDYTENTYTSSREMYFDVATINVEGIPIKVIGTHLSSSSNPADRTEEATAIFNYIKSHGFTKYIVCGDFNVGMESPLSEYNLDVFGQYLNDGCTLANGGAFGLFDTYSRNSTYTDNLKIDNIVPSSAFELKSVGVDMTKVEFQRTNGDKIDHIPFYATIEII